MAMVAFRYRFQVCNRNKYAVSPKNLLALSMSLSVSRKCGMKVFLLPSWLALFSWELMFWCYFFSSRLSGVSFIVGCIAVVDSCLLLCCRVLTAVGCRWSVVVVGSWFSGVGC